MRIEILVGATLVTAFVTFAVIGAAVVLSQQAPTWLGWVGVVWGGTFLVGFALTRFAGPFNPPFWAHAYTAMLGVVLLVS